MKKQRFSIVFAKAFTFFLIIFAGIALNSCSDDMVSSADKNSDSSVLSRSAVSFNLFIPDYQAMADSSQSENESRAIASQSAVLKLMRYSDDYVYDSIDFSEIDSEQSVTDEDSGYIGSIVSVSFSLPAGTYEAGCLKIAFFDSDENVLSYGVNSEEIKITSNETVSAVFYTVPSSPTNQTGSLGAGCMNFWKTAISANIEYTITVSVGSTDDYPDIVLFDSKGQFVKYYSVDSADDAEITLPVIEENSVYYFGIYADDENAIESYSLEVSHEEITFDWGNYTWILNNGTYYIYEDDDGNEVLHVDASESGIAIQLAESELAELYNEYPENFAVTAKIKPTEFGTGSGKIFLADGGSNFGIASNIGATQTDSSVTGFYSSVTRTNYQEINTGTYVKAGRASMNVTLVDNSDSVFQKVVNEQPYLIRLENENGVLTSYVNNIQATNSYTADSSLDYEYVERSETNGSYGVICEFGGMSFDLYSFEITSIESVPEAVFITPSDPNSSAIMLDGYLFWDECSYKIYKSNFASFVISANDANGGSMTSLLSIKSSDTDVAGISSFSYDSEEADYVLKIAAFSEGTSEITFSYEGSVIRTMTITVVELTYSETDYGDYSGFYPLLNAENIYEDDKLTICFDSEPQIEDDAVV